MLLRTQSNSFKCKSDAEHKTEKQYLKHGITFVKKTNFWTKAVEFEDTDMHFKNKFIIKYDF